MKKKQSWILPQSKNLINKTAFNRMWKLNPYLLQFISILSQKSITFADVLIFFTAISSTNLKNKYKVRLYIRLYTRVTFKHCVNKRKHTNMKWWEVFYYCNQTLQTKLTIIFCLWFCVSHDNTNWKDKQKKLMCLLKNLW